MSSFSFQPTKGENDGNIFRINFFSGDVFSPFLEGFRVRLLLREASLRTNLMGMLECWSGHPEILSPEVGTLAEN